MAEGILLGLGLSETDLLDARDSALQVFIEGRAVTGMALHAGSGVARTKQWQMLQNAQDPKMVLREIRYALYKLGIPADTTKPFGLKTNNKYLDCGPTFSKYRYAQIRLN
jgi:hypothetical protein